MRRRTEKRGRTASIAISTRLRAWGRRAMRSLTSRSTRSGGRSTGRRSRSWPLLGRKKAVRKTRRRTKMMKSMTMKSLRVRMTKMRHDLQNLELFINYRHFPFSL